MHQIATRSVTGSLARRTCKDIDPQHSPIKRLCREYSGKEDICKAAYTADSGSNKYSIVRTRRQWALWTVEEKNHFFEALFEHGKDFDAIQSTLASKHKRRNIELDGVVASNGSNSNGVKTKDQIRHCYYRTWHAISRYISTTKVEDAYKQALELFGLICYGELRKKGVIKINDRTGQRLNELVHKGSTILKVRGKNYRLKIPNCRALKKLYSTGTEETRDENKQKVPERVTVELRARNNAAWRKVQALAQNPRVRLHMKPEKTLAAILDFLSVKWKSSTQHMQQSLERDGKDMCNLHLYIPADQVLKLPEATPSRTALKDNMSFHNYLESFPVGGSRQGKLRVPSTSSQPINVYQEENAQLNDIMAEYEVANDEKKCKNFSSLSRSMSTSSCTTEAIVTLVPFDAQTTEINVDAEFTTSNLKNSLATSVLVEKNALHTEDTEKTHDATLVSSQKISVLGKDANSSKGISLPNRTEMSYASLPDLYRFEVPVDTSRLLDDMPTSLSNLVPITSVVCENITSVGLSDGSARSAGYNSTGIGPGSNASESKFPSRNTTTVCTAVLSRLVRLQGTPIDKKLGRDINIMDLYLMMSRPHIMILEYDWLESSTSLSVVEMMLNKPLSNRLRRLVDIITMEFIGSHRSVGDTRDKDILKYSEVSDVAKKSGESLFATVSVALPSSITSTTISTQVTDLSSATVSRSQIGEIEFKVPLSIARKSLIHSLSSTGSLLSSCHTTTDAHVDLERMSSFCTFADPIFTSHGSRCIRRQSSDLPQQQSYSDQCRSVGNPTVEKPVCCEKERDSAVNDVLFESLRGETNNSFTHTNLCSSVTVVHQSPESTETIQTLYSTANSGSMVMLNPCQLRFPTILTGSPQRNTDETVIEEPVHTEEHSHTSRLVDDLDSEEQWLDGESFNLSNFLPDSPLKLTSVTTARLVTTPSSVLAAGTAAFRPSSRFTTMVSSSFSDSTCDAAILERPDVESTLQCMMNESSLDYVSKFADLVAQITPTDPVVGTVAVSVDRAIDVSSFVTRSSQK